MPFEKILQKLEETKYKPIPEHVNAWAIAAQSLPAIALATLGILYAFDLADGQHVVWLLVSLTFAVVAVTWWWWVIYAIKDVHNLMKSTNETFISIGKELKQVQIDMKELREMQESQTKSTKRKTSK